MNRVCAMPILQVTSGEDKVLDMGLREDRLFAWEMGVLRRKGLQAAAAHKAVAGCVGVSSVDHVVTAATTATRQLGARPREIPVTKAVIGFMFPAGVDARRRDAAAAARWCQPASCGCRQKRCQPGSAAPAHSSLSCSDREVGPPKLLEATLLGLQGLRKRYGVDSPKYAAAIGLLRGTIAEVWEATREAAGGSAVMQARIVAPRLGYLRSLTPRFSH